MAKKIYVLHERGANSHYNGLVSLATREGYVVEFRIIRLCSALKRVMEGKHSLADCLKDVLFLLRLRFSKGYKIVIGIAPYNPLLKTMMFLLKRHDVFYHTSYTCWDGTISEYKAKSEKDLQRWRYFTSTFVRHIFAVSDRTKNELIKNGFSDGRNITVVNHSYNVPIVPDGNHVKDNTFIFVGRLTEAKGIHELLEIFSTRPNANLVIVGDGKDRNIVEEYTKSHKNVEYKGYVKGLANIVPLYKNASFVVMNSHRVGSWEELFGITIIEGMACGCVPITTDHSGPKEIIQNGISGFICQEGKIAEGIDKAIKLSNEEYQKIRNEAIIEARKYTSDNISERWKAVLS